LTVDNWVDAFVFDSRPHSSDGTCRTQKWRTKQQQLEKRQVRTKSCQKAWELLGRSCRFYSCVIFSIASS